jgi:hypothetical protein
VTTVLSVGNSEGERRCDDRCHRARTPECSCVCESRYHGKGSAEAIAQVQQDIAKGRFGDVATIDRPAQLRYQKAKKPDVVRFHRREVARASKGLGQLQIGTEERPRPARVAAGGRPHG